jgi:hypothetical protein
MLTLLLYPDSIGTGTRIRWVAVQEAELYVNVGKNLKTRSGIIWRKCVSQNQRCYAIYYLMQICGLADVYSVYSTDQQHEEYSFIDNISSFNQVFIQ